MSTLKVPSVKELPANATWLRTSNALVEWLLRPDNADLLAIFNAHLDKRPFIPEDYMNKQQIKHWEKEYEQYNEMNSGGAASIVLVLIQDILRRRRNATPRRL